MALAGSHLISYCTYKAADATVTLKGHYIITYNSQNIYDNGIFNSCVVFFIFTSPVGSGLKAFGLCLMIGRNGVGELSILSAHLSWGRIMFVA